MVDKRPRNLINIYIYIDIGYGDCQKRRERVVNIPLSMVRMPSFQTFSSPLGHLSFPDASFSGKYPVANNDEQLK